MQKQEHGLLPSSRNTQVASTSPILTQVHTESIADAYVATSTKDDTLLPQLIAAVLHKHEARHTQSSRGSKCRLASAVWQGHLEVGVLVLQDLLCEVDCSKAS